MLPGDNVNFRDLYANEYAFLTSLPRETKEGALKIFAVVYSSFIIFESQQMDVFVVKKRYIKY